MPQTTLIRLLKPDLAPWACLGSLPGWGALTQLCIEMPGSCPPDFSCAKPGSFFRFFSSCASAGQYATTTPSLSVISAETHWAFLGLASLDRAAARVSGLALGFALAGWGRPLENIALMTPSFA